MAENASGVRSLLMRIRDDLRRNPDSVMQVATQLNRVINVLINDYEMRAPAVELPTTGPMGCRGALNIRGQHFWCELAVNFDGEHPGFGHCNSEAEAIWAGHAEVH